MSTLARFADAVQNPDRALPGGLTSKTGLNDPLRFAVYRNTVHVSLVAALAKAFPVVRMLVGAQFFTAMARVFVGQVKPSSPMLFQYGEGFPAFIAGFPPAAALPYLADLARLERAWTLAYHAADDPVLAVDTLRRLPPSELLGYPLARHAASALVASRHPVGAIWQAHHRAPPAFPASTGPQAVLVTRPGPDVIVTVLPARDTDFARALLAGASIGDAAAAAAETPGFDLGTALVGLVSLGAFKPKDGPCA